MTANNVVTAQQLGRALARFVQGTDATLTPKTLYTANQANSGTLGSQVKSLYAVSSDATSAHPVTLLLVNGGTTSELCTVAVPANSGNASGTPPVSLMAAAVWPGLVADSNGNLCQNLQNGDTLMVQYGTSLSSGATIVVAGNAADW